MNRKILNLAVPNIISNLSIPLLSSVDTAVVGHLDKVAYLGAIALGTMIFNFIYWGFGFLRMGTTGLTAQAHGRRNDEQTILTLGRAVTFAIISAILLFSLQDAISYFAFYLVDATPEVEKYAREYFDIRIYAAPATLALYGFHGWFLGMQNAKYPLILSVAVNILNIIFNLVFIYVLGMKSDGVALGTVCAQYFGLIMAVGLYLKKYSHYNSFLKFKNIFELSALKNFYSVNFDIFIRTLALIFVFSYFTAVSAEFGNDVLAVNTILMQLYMILAYGVDGFAFAAESLVGKYFGAGNYNKLKEVVKLSFIWGISLGIIVSAVYALFGQSILGIYTDKVNLISLAEEYFIWIIIAPLVNSICFIWDGIFIGATATKAMRNAMIICTAGFLILFQSTKGVWGNDALWIAMTFFMLLRGGTLSYFAPKYIFAPVKD